MKRAVTVKVVWPGMTGGPATVLRSAKVAGLTGWFLVRFANGGLMTVHESCFA